MSGTYLDGIIAAHRARADDDDRNLDLLIEHALRQPPARGFARSLTAPTDGVHVIAEIKRRSPSKGDLAPGLVPSELAARYVEGGASCLSVLTDAEHFDGSEGDLREARSAVEVPVIRKDFTVSARDVCDARIMGADCVLLIAVALDDAELADFHQLARSIGLDALVETHDEAEVGRALAAGADLVGVNQRDLHTFEVDQSRAVRVAGEIPNDVTRVAESGVRDVTDAAALREAGYHALLVGETLVTSDDPVATLRELRAAR